MEVEKAAEEIVEGSGWELFPHDADVGVRGMGPTRNAALEEVACALTAAITDPEKVEPREAVEVSCEAADEELLLVEWLNALVYEMARRRMLFSRFSVHAEENRLRALAWGEQVDVARHQPAAEIKGATLTSLKFARDRDGKWVAQCIVDI